MAANKEMELAIKIAGKVDSSFNSALAKVSSSIKGATKMMAMGAVAAATAVGALTVKAVNVGREYEQAMSQVQATMLLDTGTAEGAAAMETLENAARECGRTTAFSATEAAEALNYLALAGYDADKAAAALPTVLNLAGAGAMDLARASDMVTDSMSALGIEANKENLTGFSDSMAKTASRANTSVEQLGEAILTVGGTAKSLKGGGTLEGVTELNTALGLLADNGIKGSEGGTKLRNMILSLTAPTDAAAGVLDELGVSAFDQAGNMRDLQSVFADMNAALDGMSTADRSQILNTIFNKTDLKAVNALLGTSTDRWDELTAAVSDCAGACADMYGIQLDNLNGDLAILQSGLADLGISVYQKLQPGLRSAVQFATECVTQISEAFNSGDLFGGVSGVAGGIIERLSSLPEGFRQVAAAAGALGAVNLVGTVLDSGIWKTGMKGLDTFKVAAQNAPRAIISNLRRARTAFIEMVPSGITSRVGGVFNSIVGQAQRTGSIMQLYGEAIWSNFANDTAIGRTVTKIGGAAGKIGGAVGKIGGQLSSGLSTMMGMAMKALMPAAMIGALIAGLGLIQENFGEQIDGVLQSAREKGPEIITNLANGIASRIPELVSKGSELLTNLLTTIGALAPSLMAGGAKIISSLVMGVAQNAPQMISGAVSAIGGFLSGILQALPMLLSAGMQLLLGIATGIAQNLPVMIQGAVMAIQNFIQGMTQNFPAILSAAGQIIVTLIQGIAAALPSLISGAIQIIGMLAQGLIQNLPMIIQTGVQVIAALASGIVSAIGTLLGAIPELMGMLVDAIMSTDWLQVGKDILEGIGNGIKSGASAVFGGLKDLFSGGGESIEGPSVKTSSVETTTVTPSIDTSAIASLDLSAFSSAAQNAGTAFTQGLDSTIAGYNFDTSSIGVDTAALTTSLTSAGTAGGQGLIDGLTSSVTASNFDPAAVANIDPSSMVSAMTQTGTAGGQAFTSAIDSSVASYTFNPSSVGVGGDVLSGNMQQAGTAGGQAFTNSLTSAVTSGSDQVRSAATNLANGVSTAIRTGFERAKSSASSAISAIHGIVAGGAQRAAGAVQAAFSGISITIPRPRIPVISYSMSSVSFGQGGSVSIPRFSVGWNALGGIFDEATIFNTSKGLQGVGEKGPEAILPLDILWTKMREILTSILDARSIGGANLAESLLNRLQNIAAPKQTSSDMMLAGAGGETIYFSPTYNLYGSATQEDAERAGRATFDEFKKFMKQYERENRRLKF